MQSTNRTLPINFHKDRCFLDVETTKDEIPVQVALLDSDGQIMFCEFIKQDQFFFEKTDQKVHCGINDIDLINARYTWAEASKIIQYMLRGRIVWVFNLEYDMKFFTCKLSSAFRAHCAMKRFSNFYGDYSMDYWKGDQPKYKSLSFASNYFDINRQEEKYKVISDVYKLRALVSKLDNLEIERKYKKNFSNINIAEFNIENKNIINVGQSNYG